MESIAARSRAPPREPSHVDPSYWTDLRARDGRGPRTSRTRRGSRRLRIEPPESPRYTGHSGLAAGALALSRGPRNGQRILQSALLPRAVRPRGVADQQPELLPRGVLLQRVSAASTRNRDPADAALRWRPSGCGILSPDFSGRQTHRSRGN